MGEVSDPELWMELHHMDDSDDFFFFNRWLQRISRILAVLGYEGIKQATPVVLRPKRKSRAHSL